ncbi:MAG: DMT family transporter [Burkholderiaceae bacterium]
MTHRRAVLMMIVVTLLWSTAGVVTRHLDAARSFEATFWRSAFTALALAVALRRLRGPSLWRELATAARPVWISGTCWAVMFTAFMVALTLTSVANVLVTMALGPLVTALFARLFLRHRLPLRTWAAIVAAGAGIAWMFGQGASARQPGALLGSVVALAVPIAAAVNWTLLQHAGRRPVCAGRRDDMPSAVLIGALLSALATLPFALPLQASARDIGLLSLLGIFQLAVPCLLVVRLSRILPAPELALLGLLEVVFGVLWTWLIAGESPGAAALAGGALVLGALLVNEGLAWRARPRPVRE